MWSGSRRPTAASSRSPTRRAASSRPPARPARAATAGTPPGLVDRVTDADGVVEAENTYDEQGRLATVAYPVAGGLVRTETFNYDAQGRTSGAAAVESNP